MEEKTAQPRTKESKELKYSELVLWSDNPRDLPFDENYSEQDILDRALEDKHGIWDLLSFAKGILSSGGYHYSDSPTVAKKNGKYIVWDGNRRLLLAKLKFGFINIPKESPHKKLKEIVDQIDFPEDTIPCYVCDLDSALENVKRIHSNGGTGGWSALGSARFDHYFLNNPPKLELIIEEKTSYISRNWHMVAGYIWKEIFKKDVLDIIGIKLNTSHELVSRNSPEETKLILAHISELVRDDKINTRNNRMSKLGLDGFRALLGKEIQEIIAKNADNNYSLVEGISFNPQGEKSQRDKFLNYKTKKDKKNTTTPSILDQKQENQKAEKIGKQDSSSQEKTASKQSQEKSTEEKADSNGNSNRRLTRVNNNSEIYPLFGGVKMSLKFGDINDFYRRLLELDEFIISQIGTGKNNDCFFAFERATLRLLMESAAKEEKIGDKPMELHQYIKKYYDDAKKNLNSKEKTAMFNCGLVKPNHIIGNLHQGAHNIQDNIKDKVMLYALSLICREMLKLSHGK